jgi:hypothetical protein
MLSTRAGTAKLRWEHIVVGLLAVLAAAALWMVNVEITYRRNIRHLPAPVDFHRHVITRLWKI